MNLILEAFALSSKEFNLIIEELSNILYNELVKTKSSPNDQCSSVETNGGNHVS